MRADLFHELADAVEASPQRGHDFTMQFWGNEAVARGETCGTEGCMGGIAAMIWPDRLSLELDGLFAYLRDPAGRESFDALAHVLEIPLDHARELFGFQHGLGPQAKDAAYHANRLREYVRREMRTVTVTGGI